MLLTSQEYKNEIIKVSKTDFISWDKLKNSSILITGATGLIGSYLIDVLMYLNSNNNLNCKIYALSRNKEEAIKKFSEYVQNLNFVIIEADINSNIEISEIKKIDYIIHLASNTHPKAYATDPIGTITTNIMGVYNMLEFADRVHAERMTFVSSNEIYGENRGDVEKFDEKYFFRYTSGKGIGRGDEVEASKERDICILYGNGDLLCISRYIHSKQYLYVGFRSLSGYQNFDCMQPVCIFLNGVGNQEN